MTLLLVNRRKEVLVTGMKAKACTMFNAQFHNFSPKGSFQEHSQGGKRSKTIVHT